MRKSNWLAKTFYQRAFVKALRTNVFGTIYKLIIPYKRSIIILLFSLMIMHLIRASIILSNFILIMLFFSWKTTLYMIILKKCISLV